MEIPQAYAALGLVPGATREEVRSAFRALVKSTHVERRPKTLSAAEHRELDRRWLEITAANELLQRLFNGELFIEVPRRAATPGIEMSADIQVPVDLSIHGGPHVVGVELDGVARQFRIEVPAGVEREHEFRLVGAGSAGDPPGDLVLRVRGFVKDGRFARNVADEPLSLSMQRRVTYWQVYVGRWISVSTPWATEMIELRRGEVRAVYRLRGHGVRVQRGGVEERGDLLVELDVVFPPAGDEAFALALFAAQGRDDR